MTIHLITVADVLDDNIGPGCAVDQKQVHKLLRDVSGKLGNPLREVRLKREDFNGEAIMNAVSSVSPASSDAVIFYYSGHGHRSESKTAAWPYLTLGRSGIGQAISLDAELVHDNLRAKNPRMLMVVVDCCNVVIPDQAIAEVQHRAVEEKWWGRKIENYRYLFETFEGSVLAMAAQPGEAAIGFNNGGYFTKSLLKNIRKTVKRPSAAWEPILEQASEPYRVPDNPTGYQTPIYRVLHTRGRKRDAQELGIKAVLYADLSDESQRKAAKDALFELHLAGQECVLADVGKGIGGGNAKQEDAREACWASYASSTRTPMLKEGSFAFPMLDLAGAVFSSVDLQRLVSVGLREFLSQVDFTQIATVAAQLFAKDLETGNGLNRGLPVFAGDWRRSLRGEEVVQETQGAAVPRSAPVSSAARDCPSCEENRARGALFCDRCGAKLAVEAKSVPVFCSKCGGTLESDEAFCSNCGARAGGEAPRTRAAGNNVSSSPSSDSDRKLEEDIARMVEDRLEQRLKGLDERLSSPLDEMRKKLRRK